MLEALIADQELDEEQHPSGWPSSGGWISSRYGYRRDPFTGRRAFHSGVDIANKPGSPIKAVADGVVTRAGREGAYGLMVEVNHGNGYHTRYAHASKILVDVGSRVSKGDRIAVVGSTGRSTGTHVHFEVFKDDKAVNPRKFLRAAR